MNLDICRGRAAFEHFYCFFFSEYILNGVHAIFLKYMNKYPI